MNCVDIIIIYKVLVSNQTFVHKEVQSRQNTKVWKYKNQHVIVFRRKTSKGYLTVTLFNDFNKEETVKHTETMKVIFQPFSLDSMASFDISWSGNSFIPPVLTISNYCSKCYIYPFGCHSNEKSPHLKAFDCIEADDVQGLELLFRTGIATPNDWNCNGHSLLRVRILQ